MPAPLGLGVFWHAPARRWMWTAAGIEVIAGQGCGRVLLCGPLGSSAGVRARYRPRPLLDPLADVAEEVRDALESAPDDERALLELRLSWPQLSEADALIAARLRVFRSS